MPYSVSEAAVAELEAENRRVEIAYMRAQMHQANAEARQEAIDREPPGTVCAYRQVCGRDPHGWGRSESPSVYMLLPETDSERKIADA